MLSKEKIGNSKTTQGFPGKEKVGKKKVGELGNRFEHHCWCVCFEYLEQGSVKCLFFGGGVGRGIILSLLEFGLNLITLK